MATPKKKPEDWAPLGRKSNYKKEYDTQAFKLVLLGAKDTELASFFGVRESTLNNWKKRYPSFLESLKAGKEQADATVSQSLYKRANGYSHEETVFHVVSDGSGMGSSLVATKTTKHYPPDTTAAIFWLKNRRPDLWRDKVETGFTNKKGDDVAPVIQFVPAPDCDPIKETE